MSVLAKLRVTGWAWFADGQRIQSLLLARSIMWGATEEGHAVGNVLAYQLALSPSLCFLLGLMTLVMEFGFPLILLLGPRWRLIALAGVMGFHIANLVLAYVGFFLIPIVYLAFFDLEPVWQRMRRWWRGSGLETAEAAARPG